MADSLTRRLRAGLAHVVTSQLHAHGYELVRRQPQGDPDPSLPDVDDAVKATVAAVRGYTLTSADRIVALCQAVRYVVLAGIPGSFLECGVWRGGSVMAMLRTLIELGSADRDVFMFDTWDDHMPPPSQADVDVFGIPAARYHAEFAAGLPYDKGYDQIPVGAVHRALLETGYPDQRLHFVQGLVEDTIPAKVPEDIALLRLDTDYYESTKHELEHLVPRMTPGSILIIDDYGHWQGSQQATDEYLDHLATLGVHLYLNRMDYSGRLAVIPESLPRVLDGPHMATGVEGGIRGTL